jgi:methylated-DNA-[protein]-cysteine S-methyltransferase
MLGATATVTFASPIGAIRISADAEKICAVRIGREAPATAATGHPLLAEALAQFRAWFDGRLTGFDLPLAPLDTEEGERLRHGIAAIPYGETMTYGAIADKTGSVARAVGQACKTNAFPIIIPCHRVVSASGPEYYSAGDGPRTKTWLLDFEHDHLPPERRTRLI